MEVQVSFDTDAHGFLRRECPHCEREFKWFSGDTSERPDDFVDPDAYHCPYCAQTAGHDDWYTQRQLEYANEVASAAAQELVRDELEKAFRGMRGVTYKPGEASEPPPAPFIDPADMVMVASPCHAFEPVKVIEDWTSSLHCLICGRTFTI
jgi:hypothetical protein